MAKGIKTGGRVAGVPNKATSQAREAIAAFVEGNVDRLQGWLDDIANGKADAEGKFIIAPNPEKAYQMFKDVIEYHIPKLARTEQVGDANAPIQHVVKWSE